MRRARLVALGEQRVQFLAHAVELAGLAVDQRQREAQFGVGGVLLDQDAELFLGPGEVGLRQQPRILQAQALVVGIFRQRALDARMGFRQVADVLVDLCLEQQRLVVVGLRLQHGGDGLECLVVALQALQQHGPGDQQVGAVALDAFQRLQHRLAFVRRQVERAGRDRREVGGAARGVERAHVLECLVGASGARQFGGGREARFRILRFQLDPQQRGIERGALGAHVARHARGACRHAGIARARRLLQVVLQRHVEGAAARREFGDQQRIQRVFGEGAVHRLWRGRAGRGGRRCGVDVLRLLGGRGRAGSDQHAAEHGRCGAGEARHRRGAERRGQYAHRLRVGPRAGRWRQRRERGILHNLPVN